MGAILAVVACWECVKWCGVIRVLIQRCYKRFALLRRIPEALAVNVEAVEEAT